MAVTVTLRYQLFTSPTHSSHANKHTTTNMPVPKEKRNYEVTIMSRGDERGTMRAKFMSLLRILHTHCYGWEENQKRGWSGYEVINKYTRSSMWDYVVIKVFLLTVEKKVKMRLCWDQFFFLLTVEKKSQCERLWPSLFH